MRVFIVAFICFGSLLLHVATLGQAGTGTQADKDKKAYRVIDERNIPNGGFSRVIVVSSAQATETAMRKLGEKLREDTKRDRNAFVFVYDDEKAARMRKDSLADKLSKTDQMVGAYTRNGNTGSHELVIFL